MIDGLTIVLDVGKTRTKVSLWDEQGRLLSDDSRRNRVRQADGYRALDVEGIDAWLIAALAACAEQGRIRRIAPVAHGAAAAIVRDSKLFCPPMDYEEPIADAEREAYRAERDPFADTGSPLLPLALNLGLQLVRIESLHGPLPDDATILTWPQYWAWRSCGRPAVELTSLGCHSDLWRPAERRYSNLAYRRGWALRMAPLCPAERVLGRITRELADATGLAPDCEVLCGLHDSNAALLALRGHAEIAGRDATVLSTGTWFVAMRSLPAGAGFAISGLDENRDCLLNVDVNGRPVPSARFMGGREAEIIRRSDLSEPPPGWLERELPRFLMPGSPCALPSLVEGVGPFPDAVGEVRLEDGDAPSRHVVASVYLALMTDAMLDLIGTRDCLLVEGPFAEDQAFVRVLASLKPALAVFTCDSRHDLAYGALRLAARELPPPSALRRVERLDRDLGEFAAHWQRQATGSSEPMRIHS